MKIIGYNSSHETSLCQFDTDDWVIDFLYEEERFRRQKYWVPRFPQDQLLCIERMNTAQPDAFIGASFDRRASSIGFNHDSLQYDRKTQQEILDYCLEGQLDWDRAWGLFEKFKHVITDADWEFLKKE